MKRSFDRDLRSTVDRNSVLALALLSTLAALGVAAVKYIFYLVDVGFVGRSWPYFGGSLVEGLWYVPTFFLSGAVALFLQSQYEDRSTRRFSIRFIVGACAIVLLFECYVASIEQDFSYHWSAWLEHTLRSLLAVLLGCAGAVAVMRLWRSR